MNTLEKIDLLQNIINVDENVAAYLLAESSGDLDRAIAMYFSEKEVEGSFHSLLNERKNMGFDKDLKLSSEPIPRAKICQQKKDTPVAKETSKNLNLPKEKNAWRKESPLQTRKRKLQSKSQSRPRTPQSKITSFFSSPRTHATKGGYIGSEEKIPQVSQPNRTSIISGSEDNHVQETEENTPQLDQQGLNITFKGDIPSLNEEKAEAELLMKIKIPWNEFNPDDFQCVKLKGQSSSAFLYLASMLQSVSEDTKRLSKETMLCNFFRTLLVHSPEDIYPSVCLASNQLPKKGDSDGGLGGSTISRAVAEATGASRDRLRTLYKETGDLGDVAQLLKSNQRLLMKPKPLSIKAVFEDLITINEEAGQGCEKRKRKRISKLLRSCRDVEPRFLVRMLLQHVRTGATLTSVLAALAMAVVVQANPGTPVDAMKEKVQQGQALVKECFNQFSNLETVVFSLSKGGLDLLKDECRLKVGTPVKPMLAKACNGVDELLLKMKGRPFSCEYKYDGQRCQIHMWESGANIYSRHLDLMTEKYPDAVDAFRSATKKSKMQSCIVDAELVAVDPSADFRILPFQILSTRSRKAANIAEITVNVCIYAFDLIFLNGESLTEKTLQERRRLMHQTIEEISGSVTFSREIRSMNSKDIEDFMNESINDNCEGIMAKLTDAGSEYIPSKRTDAWVKMKKDYVDDMSDSFDLVPIGAWWGNGRKAGWFSPFLLACYNPDTESYQTLCRCMSGFTDEFYKSTTDFYSKRLLDNRPPYVESLEQPSVWFQPCQVWEVRGAELTLSPVHQAAVGIAHESKGLSLRFPRFIKTRDDKSIQDATSAFDISEQYKKREK